MKQMTGRDIMMARAYRQMLTMAYLLYIRRVIILLATRATDDDVPPAVISRTDIQDVTAFIYDSAGNLTSMSQPLIGTTIYAGHDDLGTLGMISDPNGNTTKYTYDVQGRVLTVTNGGTTSKDIGVKRSLLLYMEAFEAKGIERKMRIDDSAYWMALKSQKD